jgi:competence protein ComFC
MIGALLDLVLPESCSACYRPQKGSLCEDCLSEIPVEPRKGPPIPLVDETFVLAPYTEGLQRILRDIKFREMSLLADRFGDYLANQLSEPPVINADLWTVVPLYKTRERYRGFNQVTNLFQPLINKFGLPQDQSILSRVKATPRLFQWNRSERVQLMESAFETNRSLNNSHVVLLDDILTSGTTVQTCAKSFRDQGASRVTVITLTYKGELA